MLKKNSFCHYLDLILVIYIYNLVLISSYPKGEQSLDIKKKKYSLIQYICEYLSHARHQDRC